jgi:hypothetical protein
MPEYHDPVRAVNDLQQYLAQAKAPVGFFLGAGCPFSIKDASSQPLIPDIAGLTQACRARAANDAQCMNPMATLLDKLERDGVKNPDVERILSEIRFLRQVVGNADVHGLTAPQLEALDELICGHIADVMDKPLPGTDTPYHELAAWISATPRTEPVEIFTPNYDTLMEQALERNRVAYFDGFIGSCHPFFDTYAMEEDRLPPRWARLWKLHGSINWYLDDSGAVVRGRPPGSRLCRLVHPSHLKYEESRRMPYVAMIDRLGAFLKRAPCALVACGYSFRDQHLNAVITEGLQVNPNATAFVLVYGDLASYEEGAKLARARPNLVLLAKDSGVIGGRRAVWSQRAAQAADPHPPAIEWMPAGTGMDGEETVQGQVNLGDFAALGKFLADMIGRA